MNSQIKNHQSGFIILMGMLLLVLGSAIWFGSASDLRSSSMKIEEDATHINELKAIKNRMLMYAVMHPEIFADSSSYIPGPGYFPCPDLNGDGVVLGGEASCGSGVDYAIGMVPHKISTRVFTFIEEPFEVGRYWYAVDSRFVNNNPDFTSGNGTTSFSRFAPLNINNPAQANLVLDEKNDYVMILFYSSEPLGGQNQNTFNIANFLEEDNQDGDNDFISNWNDPEEFNDYVIGISRNEWRYAMLSRIAVNNLGGDSIPDLCLDSAIAAGAVGQWFESCENDDTVNLDCPADATTPFSDNKAGQNWRTELGC